MKALLSQIQALPEFKEIISQLAEHDCPEKLGLSRSARLPVLLALHKETNRPILLLTQKSDRALLVSDELNLWSPETPHLLFPEPTSLFYENIAWGENTRKERLLTLTTLAGMQIPGAPRPEIPPVIVAPARALITRTLPKRDFVIATKTIKIGQAIQVNSIIEQWIKNGYQPASTVTTPGQFARRGGILDIWPPSETFPLRIELFGDEIDSMRQFNPATQRTTVKKDRLMLPPAREMILKEMPEEGQTLTEFHIPLVHPHSSSLIEYLPSNTLILFDDAAAFQDTVTILEEQAIGLRADYLEDGSITEDHPIPYLTLDEALDAVSVFDHLELGPASVAPDSQLTFRFAVNQRFAGKLKTLVEHIKEMQTNGDEVTIVSRQAARLQDVWQESLSGSDEKSPTFIQGSLAEGWHLTPERSVRHHLITDGEIFGWRRPQPRQRPRAQTPPPEATYADFEINDIVVHIDHGIGRFKGLVEREIEGVQHEYLCVEYTEGDQLYVPVHQADRINRYVGSRGHKPNISRLSGREWKRVKEKVQKAVEHVAEDLLELYAKRQVASGYAFSPDSTWQKELEASFPYIETEDQLKVLDDVKEDMEHPRPMDRLICGDVGYGKTEIALRAAFKSVMDGKQVAMLVPTTILAQQHFRTFRQRLVSFPVKVEMLSRFRTPAQQRQILQKLAGGEVDMIIGTHRLIQPDVTFKDLGLVIIDEEQRFGVTHKEYLKKLRTEVDVLTLTATPIPRTLYMTLTGVRDISTINTPPEERLPIVTHIGPYDAKLVRQAILRELERGGQVFFVHNRVQSIQGFKAQVARLVPEARISVAHGQMKEKELAQRMREFTNGEVDVLLSTSIIESGLDIPNANTLIIDRADTFGLAQLYQLRGRVGRGAQRAYAYFFKHKSRPSTDEGYLRLETLAENTQLGAGYSIAMRDLEIRGAGDFLGTRQHGYIASVGLNLYTRLLTQVVNQIKSSGELSSESLPVSMIKYHPIINVDLPLQISIPESYIPDKDLRLRLYRRLADSHTFDEINALKEEFTDRFGTLPADLTNLFFQLEVRCWAELAGVSSLSIESNKVSIRFPARPEGSPPRQFPNLGRDVRSGKNALWFDAKSEKEWREKLVEILTILSAEEDRQPFSSQ
ncbi:MAG: transcription-repair coupling factor [Chloroflexota bacterium]